MLVEFKIKEGYTNTADSPTMVPAIDLEIAPYTCELDYIPLWPWSYHQKHLPRIAGRSHNAMPQVIGP